MHCTRLCSQRAPTLRHLLCRILYTARSDTDHGPVENSEEGMAADAPVVEAELDVEALCSSP